MGIRRCCPDWGMSRTNYDVLKLLPLLVIYVVVILILASSDFKSNPDETSYISYASRLAQGYYSSHDHIELWWGPGYPLVLTPFILLKLPWLMARLLNALFLFGAVVYFYGVLDLYIKRTQATVFAFVFGLYPAFLRDGHLLMTECLVIFLVCGFMFHFCRSSREQSHWLHLLAAAGYLGYLALTKVLFGYVILAGFLLSFFLFVWKRRDTFKKTTYVHLLAMLLCVPYLIYTYSLTGKAFYWGTSGGMSLYWMSTPYEDELGSWFSLRNIEDFPELAHHKEFFTRIADRSEVARDEALKEQAVQNIARHPSKFLTNWAANVGRMLFSYPFSYARQKLSTYFYLGPNMFVAVLMVLCLYPALLRRKAIPYELWALLFFSIFAFGGTSVLSAYERQFRPLVPVLALWLVFMYVRVLRIQIRPEAEIISERLE